MGTEERNRRLDPRVATGEVVVQYVAPSPQARDLSVSGIYIRDSRTLQRGEQVELKLQIGDEPPFIVRGMVRRVDPGQGMAIEFIHVDAAARRLIKEFISRSETGKISAAGEIDF